MDKLRFFINRAPNWLHDQLFALACFLLLPIATMCKVCNILRGILIGMLLGCGITCLFIAPAIHLWWGL